MRDLPELYIIRHGETEWNRIRRMQGRYDSPLTEKGVAQAQEMGRWLREAGVCKESHDLIASPQGRAQASAAHIAREIGGKPQSNPLLAEISLGEWDGAHWDEILAMRPDLDQAHWIDVYGAAPGGTAFEEMWARAGALLDSLTRPTVIVTHGVTSRFIRTRAMGLSLEQIDVLPGGQGIIFRICEKKHQTHDEEGLHPPFDLSNHRRTGD